MLAPVQILGCDVEVVREQVAQVGWKVLHEVEPAQETHTAHVPACETTLDGIVRFPDRLVRPLSVQPVDGIARESRISRAISLSQGVPQKEKGRRARPRALLVRAVCRASTRRQRALLSLVRGG